MCYNLTKFCERYGWKQDFEGKTNRENLGKISNKIL